MANRNSKVRKLNVRLEAKKRKGDVISSSERRNMEQVIIKNTDSEGREFSVTCHQPITQTRPVIFKNHAYMMGKYKQPTKFRAAGE